MNDRVREELAEAIASMPAVNHHEHARSFSREHAPEFDLPNFLSSGYLSTDLMSSGMSLPAGSFDYLDDPTLPDGSEAAWVEMRPFLDRVRSTAYFRYLLISLQDLFGITEDDVFSDRWREASNRARQYSREYRGKGAELCERMQVVATVLDVKPESPAILEAMEPGDHHLLNVVRMDHFIHEERGLAQTLEKHQVTELDEWLAAFDAEFRMWLDVGVAGYKSGLAYNRRIEYADPSYEQVAPLFDKGVLTASPSEKTAYQDFMMNRLCRACVDADLPLQIHAGVQAGLGGTLANTQPTLLTSLFQRHPDLRVDLFHGGYPWCTEAGIMAKYFRNVHVDGCWLHQISPSAYRAALTSWIETVPLTKIFAWGGDHRTIEASYASLAQARDLVADVLADLVERRYFGMDLALEVAERILYRNGLEFWRLA